MGEHDTLHTSVLQVYFDQSGNDKLGLSPKMQEIKIYVNGIFILLFLNNYRQL